MKRVMTVLGTRPEIIRLSRIIAKLDTVVDHVLVHTGQNYDYELNRIFFDELGVREPDEFLSCAGASFSETIANVIARGDEALLKYQPTDLLILGDTNSALIAIPAKRRGIRIFHMEAGNRSFDFKVPEEINRRIVDHLADVNLPYTEQARHYLQREGFPPDRIYKTGSPMAEVIEHHRSNIERSEILSHLNLAAGNYFVVSAHREENVDSSDKLRLFQSLLNDLTRKYSIPIIFSCHPRTKKRLDSLALTFDPSIRVLKPFGFIDYAKLQMYSRAVLSDSGTLSEEAALLGFPAINLRYSHERPEGVEGGAAILTGFDLSCIEAALKHFGSHGVSHHIPDYCIPNVSSNVVKILLGRISLL